MAASEHCSSSVRLKAPMPNRVYVLVWKREGSQRTHSPTPLPPTFGETVQAPEGGDVETLFYPAMLHSSSRIFIQTHYILWKHPMHWGGVKPQSPTPIRTSIQDPESELPRIPLLGTSVNKGVAASASTYPSS